MTRTILAAVALTLGAVAAAHAGERLGRPEWATWSDATGTQADNTPLPPPRATPGPTQSAPVAGPASTPTAAPTLPSSTPLPAPSAPGQHGPAALPPSPHLGPGVQDTGCAQGCAGGTVCGSSCWERVWGWATFHGARTSCCGGCCGHGCGNGCGHGHCTSCDGYHCFPPLYMYFLHPCKECAGAANSGSTSSVHPGFWRNVWATGHRMFSLPTGCGCPGIQ